MKKNLYSILGVDKDASHEELKRSYKKMVFKWHPDKNPHQRDVAEERMKEINEAYNILHNAKTRLIYDSMASQLFSELFSGSRIPNGWDNNPAQTFEELFAATFQQTAGMFMASTSYAQSHTSSAVIEIALDLTLEELYSGCLKRLTLARKKFDSATAQQIPVTEILEIPVQPGWREGTRVKFAGKGDEFPGRLPADVVFVVKEQLHPCFERRGNNLHATLRVPLVTALTGGQVSLRTLDGRNLDMNITGIVTPNSSRILQGEGMPITKAPGQKGDLHLTFAVEFPQDLDDLQKLQMRCVLLRQPLPPATEIAHLPMKPHHDLASPDEGTVSSSRSISTCFQMSQVS